MEAKWQHSSVAPWQQEWQPSTEIRDPTPTHKVDLRSGARG